MQRRREQASLRVLAIESSCDETGAAVIEYGRVIRSNVVASQASIHERYGGVVPEVASRHQLSALIPVVEAALREASATWDDIDAIAATYGPGLAGSLLVGLTGGKALALARGLPFIGVNHLEAHIYANWLHSQDAAPAMPVSPDADEWPGDPRFPLLALVISGAHSELVSIPEHGRYELLGQTRDDAAGEAFDKVARVMGLGYPGGPAIQRAAATRDPARKNPFRLPRAWLNGTWDFSFSGLKTAVLQLVEGEQAREYGAETPSPIWRRRFRMRWLMCWPPRLCARRSRVACARCCWQAVSRPTSPCASDWPTISRLGIDLRFPPVALCTDNAAMIGAAACSICGRASGLA